MFGFIKKMIDRCFEHDIGQIAGQLAYFSLLSVFPFVIFMNRLIISLNFSYSEIAGVLILIFPENMVDAIMKYIEYISASHTPDLLSAGLIMLIYSSSRIIRSLEKSINTAYEITEKRGFFKSLIRSMLLVICFGIIVLLMILAAVISKGLLGRLFATLGLGEDFLHRLLIFKWMIVAAITYAAMTAIYYFMPNMKVKFKTTVPGALAAVAGFALLSAGFGIYVRIGLSHSVLYGSIGAVFLLLIWLYAAGIIIVTGAELNSLLMKKKTEET